MTAQYIKSKIQKKAAELSNTSCLIPYCVKAFAQYFTEEEVIKIINAVDANKPKKTYKSFFSLGN